MSRAGTLELRDSSYTSFKPISRTLSGTQWTGVGERTVSSSSSSLDQYESSVTEVPLDNQARSMDVSFNKIIQSLSQTSISSIRLKLQLTSSFAQGRYRGQSSLVDMPPHTVKHVIMNVKRMGRGPLPDFDFDELAEE